MSHRSCLALVAVLLALCFSSAHAAPVAYDEAITGVDLPGTGFPLTTFDLDYGLNSVKGTFGTDAGNINDFDSFAIVVPAGMSVTVATVDVVDNLGNIVNTSWNLRRGSAFSDQGTFLGNFSMGSPGTKSFPALTAETYNFTHNSFGLAGDPPASANYIFSLTVVPEPATLGLLAFAAPALLRRRR